MFHPDFLAGGGGGVEFRECEGGSVCAAMSNPKGGHLGYKESKCPPPPNETLVTHVCYSCQVHVGFHSRG